MDIAITVHNLTKRYGNVVAVNNISFDVHRSELFGFLGPNGAGKTTTCMYACACLATTWSAYFCYISQGFRNYLH
jgi:ABC-2 type transport system ATP-binding protein